MSLTISQAHDSISATFLAAWSTVLDPNTSQPYPVKYENVPPSQLLASLMDGSSGTLTPWARLTIRDNDSSQRTLGGTVGQRILDNTGVLSVEIFVPSGAGMDLVHSLAKLVRDAFVGPNGADPWYRNARIQPLGEQGRFYRIQVLAEFFYEEIV